MASPFVPIRWLIDVPNITSPDFLPLLPGQTFLIEKTPIWSTRVQTSKSGRELRAQAWSSPRWRFQVGYELLRDRPPTQDELRQLYSFFNLRQGRFGTFYYNDPSEPAVEDQFLGHGDGVNQTFQLIRTHNDFTEPVYKTTSMPTIKINGVATTEFSLEPYGVIMLNSPPAEGDNVSWSGNAAYWCRFDSDEINPAQMVKDIWSLDGITFLSLKP